MEQEKINELKAKIAQIKKRYGILRAMAGPRGISPETTEEYAKEIENLQAQIQLN